MTNLEQFLEEPIFTGLQCPPRFDKASAELIDFKDLLCRYLSKNLAHGLFTFEFDKDGCLMATREMPDCGAFADVHLWWELRRFLSEGLHVHDMQVLPEFDGDKQMVDLCLESARARAIELFGSPRIEHFLGIPLKRGQAHNQKLKSETQAHAEFYARMDHRKKQLDALWQWIFDNWEKITVKIPTYMQHIQSVNMLEAQIDRERNPHKIKRGVEELWALQRSWKENSNSSHST